ncbi:MAG: septum formation protein Maf [Candidatus Levybacteria bacterium RBG_16_35_6]|nr:MAG: septum formation protein Maf [Candidatus Levybacteria bacterium RBG_16_35_6]
MRKIVLASKSPRRKGLLKQMGIDFIVDVSDVDEDKFSHSSPVDLVKKISKEKARIVSKRHKDAIIISADTIVVLNGKIIGKPKDKKDAKEILMNLSGKTHIVITGFTILDTKNKKEITKTVKSKVKVKKLSRKEINNYVETGEPLDKAGAYGIQDKGGVLIESVSGDCFNVVGLPIFDLSQSLKKFGIEVSDFWK